MEQQTDEQRQAALTERGQQLGAPVAVTMPAVYAAPVEGGVFSHSASIAKLAGALAQAQLKYGDLKATQTADAEKYTYNYADLASVLAAVRPALAGEGIAILQGVSMQRSTGSGGLIVLVESRLVHQSGEWIATTLRLPSGEVAPQKVGSLVSYLRRYGLLAISGVAAEDDDGKQASEAPKPPRATRPVPPTELPPEREPKTAKPVTRGAPKPVHASKPGAVDETRHQPIGAPGGITPADRGLLFKIAKEQGRSERQVKALIFALWAYTSTSQIKAGREFNKVLSALESPDQHGVLFEDDDVVYTREDDPNALPVDVTEGM